MDLACEFRTRQRDRWGGEATEQTRLTRTEDPASIDRTSSCVDLVSLREKTLWLHPLTL